ncbi:MAG: hypothetical protein SCALA702_36300 [Melioribacteraceae bacterium]|nr:MAG: hypothetical protein SCALA702_36300 [Melioribacteraceae bacterium]
MNRNSLLGSAKKLNQVSEKSFNEYSENSESLIFHINNFMGSNAEIQKLVGNNDLTIMKTNHTNHVKFMASIFKQYNPEVFVDTILWAFSAYRNHGFHRKYFEIQLAAWDDILSNNLSEESYMEIIPYYEWIIKNIPVCISITENQAV